MGDCEFCRLQNRTKTAYQSSQEPSTLPANFANVNQSVNSHAITHQQAIPTHMQYGTVNNALQQYLQTYHYTQQQLQQMAISHAQMNHNAPGTIQGYHHARVMAPGAGQQLLYQQQQNALMPFMHPQMFDSSQMTQVTCEKHMTNTNKRRPVVHHSHARRRYHYMNSIHKQKLSRTIINNAGSNTSYSNASATQNTTVNSLLTPAIPSTLPTSTSSNLISKSHYQPSSQTKCLPNGSLFPRDDFHLQSNGILNTGSSTALHVAPLPNVLATNYSHEDFLDDTNLLFDENCCSPVPPIEDRYFDDFDIPYFTSNNFTSVDDPNLEPKPVYGNLLEVIEDRLRMYKAALEKAQIAGDGSKVRRYTRQIKTLEDQKRSVNAGKVVKDEDIPPPISVSLPPPSSSNPLPQNTSSAIAPNQPNSATATSTAPSSDGTTTVPSSSSGSEHSPTTDLLQTGGGTANAAAVVSNTASSLSPGIAAKSSNIAGNISAHHHQQHSLDSESGATLPEDQQTLLLLKRRQYEYKVAAHQANKQGDKPAALKYVRVIKGFEEVINAVESGKSVDISNLPGPPPLIASGTTTAASGGENSASVPAGTYKPPSTDNSSLGSAASSDQQHQQSPIRHPPAVPMTSQQPPTYQPPPHNMQGPSAQMQQQPQAPSSGDENLDALISRMNVFKDASDRAKQAGDASKARRQDRLKNQYMDAIKAYRNNRRVDWESLTNPLGFPPLPNTAAAAAASSGGGGGVGGAQQGADYDPIASLLNAAVQQIHNEAPQITASSNQQGGIPASDSSALTAGVLAPTSKSSNEQQQPQNNAAAPRAPPPVPPNHPSKQSPANSSNTTASTNSGAMATTAPALPNKIQMTVEFLEKRQQQYRSAAIAAKKRNEVEEAKRYLKLCKGFDPMIAAAKLGKPVDLAQIPPALTGTMKATASSSANTNPLVIPVEQPAAPKHNADPKEVASLFQSIEQQLQLQINKCRYDSEYYASIGEIANVNKAEKMLQCSAVDLNIVQACRLRGELPPKMHYEQRAFTKIRVNNDLNEGECEVLVSRAINLPCSDGVKPGDLSTYAKWSFPWPSDSSTTGQTNLVKNTDKPVYNFKQKLPISDKKDRMSRQVRRKTFDVTVYTKGGIFKSDRPIGVAQVKLEALDKKCTLHEVVQLMDPVHTRSKSTCGKIEVSVRVREPFVTKDTEDVIEKWLVVDAEPTKPIHQPKTHQSPQKHSTHNNPPPANQSHQQPATDDGQNLESTKDKKRAQADTSNEQDPNTLNPNSKSPKNRKSPRPPPRALPPAPQQ
ncbi:coiled-coil and C2 domain-containing protein 1-like isoform X2 [Convolutriloba macropyga]|uniref:coiled-coil and C2 domain-containing protein 1-like isoform X2 n=1 Tax=Convolutriloba macropyga TaxID=536237 RepID=UPI003F51D347